MLVKEALEGQVFSKYFGKKSKTYQYKFRKIAKRANVLELDIEDADVAERVMALRSWNWAGFIFSFYWTFYRKLTIAWVLLAMCICFLVASSYLPEYKIIFGALTIGISFAVAMKGNGILFLHYLNAINNDKPEMCEPSFFRIFLLFFGFFLVVFATGIILSLITA